MTLTLPSFESPERLIARKLAVKTTTFRTPDLDTISSIKTLLLAESVSLTEGESLRLREYIAEVEIGSPEYVRCLEVMKRAALPFMLEVLLKRVTSFESPSAALSAYWCELDNAVLRWEPQKYHVNFRWFIKETLATATRRLISDEKGNRANMERVMALVALLKTFRKEEIMETIEHELEDGEFYSANLDAEAIFTKIVQNFGPIYLEETDQITGNPKKNPVFWKQPFTSQQSVEETLTIMLNLRPLSLDYSVDSEMGTLKDTIAAGDIEDDEDYLYELEYQATKLARWDEVLANMTKDGLKLATLEKHADEIGAYLRKIASMNTEERKWIPALRETFGVPNNILELAEEHMLPFYNEYS